MDTGTAILQNKLFSKITTQVKQKNKPLKETSNEKDQNGKKIKKISEYKEGLKRHINEIISYKISRRSQKGKHPSGSLLFFGASYKTKFNIVPNFLVL